MKLFIILLFMYLISCSSLNKLQKGSFKIDEYKQRSLINKIEKKLRCKTQVVYKDITKPQNMPEILKRVAPKYPDLAVRAGIQSTVIVIFTVDTNGLAQCFEILQGHPLLLSPAIEAVRQYRFKPGYINQQKVPVKWAVPIRFRLKLGNFSESGFKYKHIYKDKKDKRLTLINWKDIPKELDSAELEFEINTNGDVKNIRLLKSTKGYETQAIEFVKSLKYKAVKKNEIIINYKTQLTLPIKF